MNDASKKVSNAMLGWRVAYDKNDEQSHSETSDLFFDHIHPLCKNFREAGIEPSAHMMQDALQARGVEVDVCQDGGGTNIIVPKK